MGYDFVKYEADQAASSTSTLYSPYSALGESDCLRDQAPDPRKM